MATAVLQPDPTDGKDTMLSSGNPTTNYGSSTSLTIGTGFGGSPPYENASALIEFPISDLGLSDVTVTDAVLSIYSYSAVWLDLAPTVYAYELLRDWVESEATHNIFSSGNNWQTAGANGDNDRDPTAVGSAASEGGIDWIDISLDTDLVQGWIDGTIDNNGVKIFQSGENGLNYLYSSDYTTDTTKRPKLTITYTPNETRKLRSVVIA